MKEPWGKFYAKTFTGSMRGCGSHVVSLMAYCIANAKPPSGELEINIEVVAFLIGDPVERMQAALDYLMSEDSTSRTPDENGRRLIKTGQYSYRLVNWLAHREGLDDEARRAYWASKQKDYRKRKQSGGNGLTAKQRKLAADEDAKQRRHVRQFENGTRPAKDLGDET